MPSLPNANSSLKEVDNILLSFLDEDRLVSELTIGIAKEIDTRYAREYISHHSHLPLNRDNLPKNTLLTMLTLEVFSQDPQHYTKVLLEMIINEYIASTIDKTIRGRRIMPLTSEELRMIWQHLPIHAILLLLKLNKYLEKTPITTCDIEITDHEKSVLATIFKGNPCDSVMKILGMSHEEIEEMSSNNRVDQAILKIACISYPYSMSKMPPNIIEFFANINRSDLNALQEAYINQRSMVMLAMFLCKLKDIKDDNINVDSIKQCIQTIANDFNPMSEFLAKLSPHIWSYDYNRHDNLIRPLLAKNFDDNLTQEAKDKLIDIRDIYDFYNKHRYKDFAIYACAQHLNDKTPLDKVSKFGYIWHKFKWDICALFCMTCLSLFICCVYNMNYISILLMLVVYCLIRVIVNAIKKHQFRN